MAKERRGLGGLFDRVLNRRGDKQGKGEDKKVKEDVNLDTDEENVHSIEVTEEAVDKYGLDKLKTKDTLGLLSSFIKSYTKHIPILWTIRENTEDVERVMKVLRGNYEMLVFEGILEEDKDLWNIVLGESIINERIKDMDKEELDRFRYSLNSHFNKELQVWMDKLGLQEERFVRMTHEQALKVLYGRTEQLNEEKVAVLGTESSNILPTNRKGLISNYMDITQRVVGLSDSKKLVKVVGRFKKEVSQVEGVQMDTYHNYKTAVFFTERYVVTISKDFRVEDLRNDKVIFADSTYKIPVKRIVDTVKLMEQDK